LSTIFFGGTPNFLFKKTPQFCGGFAMIFPSFSGGETAKVSARFKRV